MSISEPAALLLSLDSNVGKEKKMKEKKRPGETQSRQTLAKPESRIIVQS